MSLNNYSFDADQRMTDETQVGQSGGNGVAQKQLEFQYNALGQFTSIARYDFVGVGPMVDIATAALSYDAANRMTNLAYTGQGGSVSIDAFSFALDNANRITSRTSTLDGTANYGYDVTNQVTSAAYTGSGQPPNEAYSYSKNGNRTNTGYSTGTNNQLLSDGTFNYQYDGEGNRTIRTRISNAYASDYKTVYGWDYRDRLTDVSYYDNNGVLTEHVHYVYDTLDHEIGKQVDDTGGGSYDRAEWYSLDVVAQPPSAGVPSTVLADPLLQFTTNGNLQYRYLNGPTPAGVDAVMGEEGITTPGQAGADYWPLGDQVNTPHETVNNGSTVADHIITNTFGVVTSESNPSIHHWAGFEGGHFDPDSVLVSDDHRWYDPVVGRWISEDPEGFAAGDANLARYTGNEPTNDLDATGLSFWSDYVHYGQNIWSGMATGAANGAVNGAVYGGASGAIATGGPGLGPGMAAGGIIGGGVGLITGAISGWNANSPMQAAQSGAYHGGQWGGAFGGMGAAAYAPQAVAATQAAMRAQAQAQAAVALSQQAANMAAARAAWSAMAQQERATIQAVLRGQLPRGALQNINPQSVQAAINYFNAVAANPAGQMAQQAAALNAARAAYLQGLTNIPPGPISNF